MTGIEVPPNVMLLTYTELAIFLMLIGSLFCSLEPVSSLDGPWWTSKGMETAETAWTKHRKSQTLRRMNKKYIENRETEEIMSRQIARRQCRESGWLKERNEGINE